jgi:hypothetical protein
MAYTLEDNDVCVHDGSIHILSKSCLGSAVLTGAYVARVRVDTFWKRLYHLFSGY